MNQKWPGVLAAGAWALAVTGAAPGEPLQNGPAAPGVIRVETRLVEVEVVVRDAKGSVTGLTRDDFTLLDQGEKQKIAVFNSGAGRSEPSGGGPGLGETVSNRATHSGQPIAGATVLLLDQLNTSLDNQAYSRGGLLKYLESGPEAGRTAIYLLGRNLSVAQDFTDDREVLARAVRKWNPKINPLFLIQSTEMMDAIDRRNYDDHPDIRRHITAEAMAKIAEHLSGMPGRKNLVWVSDTPGWAGAQFLAAANIHLYPVLARGVGTSGVTAWLRDAREAGGLGPRVPIAPGTEMERQRSNSALAAANGSAAFSDSRDITAAVHRAVEDAASTYVLGFYPAENSLDNRFHALTVIVNRAQGKTLEARYRPGYLATRAAPRAPAAASMDEVLQNPLDATAIGITAAGRFRDGTYEVEATVDLRDVHFTMQGNQHAATLSLSFADSASHPIETGSLQLHYTDSEFAAALARGLKVSRRFGQAATVRFAAQDAATRLAGSLWIAAPEKQ